MSCDALSATYLHMECGGRWKGSTHGECKGSKGTGRVKGLVGDVLAMIYSLTTCILAFLSSHARSRRPGQVLTISPCPHCWLTTPDSRPQSAKDAQPASAFHDPVRMTSSPLLVPDLVDQRADLLDFDSDVSLILEDDAGLAEEANARGRSGQEDRAGLESRALREVAD